MLWLFGPTGVGKSAVAQTIGEYATERGLRGATVFLSRTRKLDDPTRLVTSISYQLAMRNPAYKRLVMEALKDDPTILDKDERTQFKKLLVEPFATLSKQKESFQKLLVIIDGLDECRGDMEQVGLVGLITEDLRSPAPLPLLWMICSRPERHLTKLFEEGSLLDLCWKRDLSLDGPDGWNDVERYLGRELERIGSKYYDRPGLSRSWSFGEENLKRLVRATSGLFLSASGILRFIDDPAIADPASRLNVILELINSLPGSFGDGNPLGLVDMLYLTVLRELEDDYIRVALDLLGTCIVCPPIPVLHLANLLGVRSRLFYASLRSLHSVLTIPHPGKAHRDSLRFFHTSFPDFLLSPARSKEYSQDPDLCHSRLVEASFRVLDNTTVASSKSLSWRPSNFVLEEAESPSALSIAYDTLSFVATHTWHAFTQIPSPKLELLRDTVANFDFSRLRSISEVIPVRPFIHFLRRLHALVSRCVSVRSAGTETTFQQKLHPELMNFVRTSPLFSFDEKFVEKCRPLLKPFVRSYLDNIICYMTELLGPRISKRCRSA